MPSHGRFARPSVRAGYCGQMLSGLLLGVVLGFAPLNLSAQQPEGTFNAAVADSAGEDAAIAGFYQAQHYQSLWTGAKDAPRRAAFFAALARVGDHGLPASRYKADALLARFHTVASEVQRARLEVDVTRTFLRYARDVQTGFLTPSAIDKTIVRAVPLRDPSATLSAFAVADPATFLSVLPPQSPEYAELQRARLDLTAVIESGGWGPKVETEKLELGATGPAALALRDRLIAQGYLMPTVTASFDGDVSRALQQFQMDHGLTPDGVAGEGTIGEINRDPEDRLQSVLVAMERLRWMNGLPLGKRHIWVNLPDFTAKIVDDGKVTFETVTVVGQNRPDTRSPEFSDQMEFMGINPTWNVPRSITVKEYLPKLQKDPNAAAQLRITDRQGNQIDRASVDFTQFTEANFPFHMSQAPSDGNALGKVKFMFPNQWNIYLHDTPQKPLFAKEVRAFSHGCIRLGQPFSFAYALLAPQTNDPEKLFKSYLNTDRESVLTLAQPVPVHLVYFTAWPDARGHIGYRRDVYGRDKTIFAAMKDAGVALPGLQG
ncbi:MAG: L,D-transpeptidase family protein [Rhodobacteraceae bacterium]|nr:L,D-transpeptidase family protein [Paracoccaceae bacterium]